jgi:hypothetical protein
MTIDQLKIKEIIVSRSGVLPTGYYENVRPSYSITVEPKNNDSAEMIIESCNEYLKSLFEFEDQNAKAELLAKRYKQFRWYYRKGRKYISVTTVLGWGDRYTKFKQFTDDELAQYAAQGNIIEALITEYLKTGKWIEPEKESKLKDDVLLLKVGGLQFNWNNCTHKAFMEKYRDKIEPISYQQQVFNDEYSYAGTLDILGKYDGKLSIIDIKRNTFDMRQLAAYAKCLEGIEQLVIFKVGPTDNKCGYFQPIVCTDIDKEFEGFLSARSKFKANFGL